jgi:hypothetical protein
LENDFNQVSVGFTLEQSYSNPFWSPARSGASREISATTIRYQLPKTTQVALKIYNIFGQEVRTPTAVCWSMRDSLPV